MTSKRDYCYESDNGSFCCTERPGHTGDHEARTAPGGRVAHRWPNVSPTAVEFRPGDHARITEAIRHEGTIEVSAYGGHLILRDEDGVGWAIPREDQAPVRAVELLSRRCPQVGDVLTGAELAAWVEAPDGTLVVWPCVDGPRLPGVRTIYRMRSRLGWVATDTATLRGFGDEARYRVEFVPSSVPGSSGETS